MFKLRCLEFQYLDVPIYFTVPDVNTVDGGLGEVLILFMMYFMDGGNTVTTVLHSKMRINFP